MSFPSKDVLTALVALAPLELAESWDNVGLLIDPGAVQKFEKAFFVIDLTTETLAEALAEGCDLIVAYHPPIFSGLSLCRLPC